jgi:hypothetical protein
MQGGWCNAIRPIVDNESMSNEGSSLGIDPDLCRNTMKYRNTHKHRDAAEIRLHFINNK